MHRYTAGVLAASATMSAFAAGPASSDTEVADLRAKIAQLENRIDTLQTDSGDKWLTEKRAAEIRSIVHDVLADADTRANLQGSGMMAGYDKGFFLASADGNFKLKIGGVIQFRYVYNSADELFSQGGTNFAGLQSLSELNFGDLSATNPNGTIVGLGGGLSDLVATGGGSRLALYNDAGLMFALGFSEAERDALRSPFVTDTDLVTPGVQLALSPGQIGDLDRQTSLFITDRIAALTDAQRDAFAAALGSSVTIAGLGTVAVPGFTNVNGMPVSFSNFSEYSSFLAGLYSQQLRNRSNGDSNRDGFELRRVQLNFGGHVVNPQWQYYIMTEGSRSGGAFSVRDAWIKYDAGSGWGIKAGQFKAPLLREELVSDSKHQAVERTLINSMFTVSRLQGIAVEYKGDPIRGTAMLNDGGANALTNGQASINVPWETEHFEGFGMTGRLEWLIAGNWDQFDSIDSFQGDPFGAMLGIAAHYDKEEYGTGAFAPGSAFRNGAFGAFNNDEIETFTATADASINFGGANIYGAIVYRHIEADGPFIKQVVAGRNTFDQDQFGFQIQGGIFLTSDWEVFARYEWADADMPDVRVGGVSVYSFDDLNVVTVGVNKYFAKHQVKWQLDGGFAFDRVEFFAADTGSGWRNQTGSTDDSQFVIRSQLQLVF